MSSTFLTCAHKAIIMEISIDVVKLIGKRGLSYRESNEEPVTSLYNLYINYGTCLELV